MLPRDQLIVSATQQVISISGVCAAAFFGINAVGENLHGVVRENLGEILTSIMDLGLALSALVVSKKANRLIDNLGNQDKRV